MKNIPLFRLLKNMYCRFQDDEVPALGAQMTYYLILSFFPFLIFLFTLSAYTPLSREDVVSNIVSVLPESSQPMVRGLFQEIRRGSSGTLLSVGMAAAVWTASNGMMAIIRTLNKAYDEEEHRSYLKVRLLSVVYTLGFTLTVLLSFVLLVFGHLLAQLAFRTLALPADFEKWWVTLKYISSLMIMCAVFSLLYYSAPSRKMSFRAVLPGAIIATAGWVATSLLFSLYVNRVGDYTKTYGSIGGIIALLVWLYISSIILLLGGELNAELTFVREGKTKTECKAFGFRFPFMGSTKN